MARQDPRFRVGQTDLVAVLRPGFGRLRFLPPRFPARLPLGFAAGYLVLVLLLRPGVALRDPLDDLGLRLRQGLQPVLPSRQLLRQVDALRRLRPIGLRRSLQQGLYFLSQLRLQLLDVAMGQGLVLGGVGFDLGPVQRNLPELHQLHRLRQAQHLDEQVFQFHQKSLPEVRQGVVVGMGLDRQKAERHRIVGGPLDLATGEHAGGIAIDQQGQQHRRVVCRRETSSSSGDSAKLLPPRLPSLCACAGQSGLHP